MVAFKSDGITAFELLALIWDPILEEVILSLSSSSWLFQIDVLPHAVPSPSFTMLQPVDHRYVKPRAAESSPRCCGGVLVLKVLYPRSWSFNASHMS